MTDEQYYPSEAASFKRILRTIERSLRCDFRLPDWPFVAATGNADMCQFSLAVEGPFGAVLQELVGVYGDANISFAVLDPSPEYYRKYYGSYPAFTTPGEAIAEAFWGSVSYEPEGDPTGSVAYTANVVAIAGDSGSWAVWGERSWDIAIVLSSRRSGPWKSVGVDFVPAVNALADFTEPAFKQPLADSERAAFLNNVRQRGTDSDANCACVGGDCARIAPSGTSSQDLGSS